MIHHSLWHLWFAFAFLLPASMAFAQPPANALPNARLLTVVPAGGRAGTTVEVSFTGTDLEDPKTMLVSHPAVKVTPVIPPAAPSPKADPKKPAAKPDPKKPAPSPAPPPPITKFKITIPGNLPVGTYDIRLVGKWGVSNPRAFVVGDLPEIAEKEPNNEVEQAQRVELNSTINGVIAAPTDVDYFVFAGKKGQRVIVSCLSSSIDSRLHPAIEVYDKSGQRLGFNHHYQGADALVDCMLAADGDYFVRLHEYTYTQGDGEHFYRLTLSTGPWIDAVFPHVVEPGKSAKVTVFGRNLPGGRADPSARVLGTVIERTTAVVNVPSDPAALVRLNYSGRLTPTSSAQDGFEFRVTSGGRTSNPCLLTYARAPVTLDNEANDTPQTAQEVTLPCEICGRIEKKHDRDWYRFSARKGDVYMIEVYSERLGAQTDMYFTLRNPATKQEFGEFDDNADVLNPTKFFTQTTDPQPYRFVVPVDGKYQLMVSSRDADVRSSPRQLYRVRITAEQPDFRLIAMPANDTQPDSVRLLPGGHQYMTVLAWRLDGFNGPIQLSPEGLPAGVSCSPQVIPAGLRQVSVVLSSSLTSVVGVHEIKVVGRAEIGGQTVIREARPATITWPVNPGQGIPAITRLDRGLFVSIGEKAPFALSGVLDHPAIVQGDKANLALKLARLWPDFKTPLQATGLDITPNVLINNNQPMTLNPGKDEASFPVVIQPGAAPGDYTLVLHATAPVPFSKDPMAKNKPAVTVVQSSTPIPLTIVPKQVASLALANGNLSTKPGSQQELVVRFSRMYDYKGEFKVQVVFPPKTLGITADEVIVPAGKDEARLVVRVGRDAPVGSRPNLVVRALALVNGKYPTTHEAKFNLNVVK
jgi:hypothetical protein